MAQLVCHEQKQQIIKEFIRKRVPDAVIARILEVNRITLRNYANSRGLRG